MRKARRIFVDEPARLHPNSWSSLEVQLLDCSEDGFRAHCEARVRRGDLVTLEVPGGGPTKAQISWCKGQEFGARFLERVVPDPARLLPSADETMLARLRVPRAGGLRTHPHKEEDQLRHRFPEGLAIRRR